MGWLERYLQYTADTEAPAIFHFWSAVAVLGHILGRRTWFNRWKLGFIYPAQIMVLLVSKSAIVRKTAAIGSITGFVQSLPDGRVNTMPDLTSLEGMLKALEGRTDATQGSPEFGQWPDSVGIILNDELGSLISKATYAERIVTWITKLNTCQDARVDIKFRSWNAILKNPCIGMLAATTPTGIAKELPHLALTGGLLGRTMLIYDEEPKGPNSMIYKPEDMTREKVWLIQDLERIAKLKGEYAPTKTAQAWFDNWYNSHTMWQRGHPMTSEQETGWQARKHDHVLRLAMVLAASDSDKMIINSQLMRRALALVDHAHGSIPAAMVEIGTRDKYGNITERIITILEKHGPQTWSDLLRRLSRYATAAELEIEMRTLVEAGQVRVYWSSTGARVFAIVRPQELKEEDNGKVS